MPGVQKNLAYAAYAAYKAGKSADQDDLASQCCHREKSTFEQLRQLLSGENMF